MPYITHSHAGLALLLAGTALLLTVALNMDKLATAQIVFGSILSGLLIGTGEAMRD